MRSEGNEIERNCPEAVDFFEANTELQFDLGTTFADYHPDAPGGMDAGRSFVARPYDARAESQPSRASARS